MQLDPPPCPSHQPPTPYGSDKTTSSNEYDQPPPTCNPIQESAPAANTAPLSSPSRNNTSSARGTSRSSSAVCRLLRAASVPRASRRRPASPRLLLRKLCRGGVQAPVARSSKSSCCGTAGRHQEALTDRCRMWPNRQDCAAVGGGALHVLR